MAKQGYTPSGHHVADTGTDLRVAGVRILPGDFDTIREFMTTIEEGLKPDARTSDNDAGQGEANTGTTKKRKS